MNKKASTKEIYDYILKHPDESDWELALHFGKSQDSIRGVRRRYGLMHRNGRWHGGFRQPESVLSNIELITENRILKKELNEARERNTMGEIIANRILEVLPNMNKYPVFVPEKPRKGLKEEEWILTISDVQLGQKIGKEEMGGLGEYNFGIFKRRINFFLESLKHVVNYHVNPPNTLRIFFLGDIVEGSTIYHGQGRSLDLLTIDQVFQGVEHFSQLIYELARIFPQIKCYGIPGNHGRIGDKGENSLMDNLDILTYRWIKERLVLSGVKNVTFDVSKSWYQLVYVNGWVFLIEHGDSFKGWAGIPFYGAQRAKMNFQDLLQDFEPEFVSEEMRAKHIQLREKFHYVVFGDKHIAAQFRNIFMNGCWPGGSELSLKYMQQAGLPQQWLKSVSNEYGVVWARPIFLDKPRSSVRKVPLYG